MDFDEFLREACHPLDLQWRKYRRRAARHRLRSRMSQLGIDEYAAYLSYLRSHPVESSALADLMAVTVSRFFRERASWQRLVGEIIPAYLAARPPAEAFRAWSAGCCGGEEPFTLVILWKDLLASSFPLLRLDVRATDIDGASLARASRGSYPGSSLREIPKPLRGRWFRQEGGLWALRRDVRDAVIFEESNLMTGEPPKEQDLVLCRYLAFTYYRGNLRLSAARKLASSMKDGGLLFIGRKEGLAPEEKELFEPLAAECGIFRRKEE